MASASELVGGAPRRGPSARPIYSGNWRSFGQTCFGGSRCRWGRYPALFAVALFLSVPRADLWISRGLILLWMGASVGLLAIVDERRIIEHEQLVFLDVPPYLLGKMACLGACSVLQTSFFVSLLTGLQRLTEPSVEVLPGVGGAYWLWC